MKKNKKIKDKRKIGILLLLIILVICLTLVLCKNLLFNKSNFKIESRQNEIKKTIIPEDNNYKLMGWIRVQGTNIDMPILHNGSEKNEVFPVELESFSWSENYKPKFHNRLWITGHNIFNLSSQPILKSEQFNRFEELMDFVYYDFAKENEYIQLTIDDNDYVYKIFSVGFIPYIDKLFFPSSDDYSKDEMKDHLKNLKSYNIYNYDIDVNENDDIITLATCTRFYGVDNKYIFHVTGRLLRKDEKITNYEVTKNKKYKNIEKILKGESENE